jgi:hypothetical protein
MTEEEFKQIDYLCSLNEAGMTDKERCRDYIRKYLDPGFSMCATCDPQVQAAFKRLRIWWSTSRVNYENLIFTSVKEKKSKKK